jgi:intein/homing endonuclease
MMVGGKQINKPIDDFNHCFVGDTMVTTKRGQVPIKDVEVGDKVLTASGYKSVLIKHNNGLKQVAKYSLQLDTFIVSLCCTNNHKIKTTKGWKKISKLKQGMNLYLAKSLMERNIIYTTMKDISLEEQKGYIELFGNTQMVKYLMGIIFTMWMKILITILLITLILLEAVCILGLLAKKGLEVIQNLLKTFMHLVLRQPKYGIGRKKVDCGILKTVKNLGLIKSLKTLIAKFVVKNLNHDIKELSNIATTTVKLKHFEIEESWNEEVYDLTIEDAHEYFANGVLVHNCMDAIRYAIYTKYSKKKLIIF